MLEFIPFKKGHLDFFEPSEQYADLPQIYAEFLDRLGVPVQAASHMKDGKILYISGYYEKLPGNFECVIIPSKHLPDYKFAVIRDIRMWLGIIQKKHNPRRMQTFGENTKQSKKWLTLLGFEFEGLLRQYDEDGDKTSWSIIPWQDS